LGRDTRVAGNHRAHVFASSFLPEKRRRRFEATPCRGSLKLPPAAPGFFS
jgi:hypothetical protein